MRLLLAEDSGLMRRVLVGLLEEFHYEVVEAEDGEQAWKQFQEQPFPLVLTDWMMPGMDGVELVKKIRAHCAQGYTYIILLTSKTEKEALVEAMEAGADDFLIKPCDSQELRVRVREGERIIKLEQTLAEQNHQLRETQAALVQSEKMASLGQLAAGMAHEINNPISYVANNLAVLRREATSLSGILAKYRAIRQADPESVPDMLEEVAEIEQEEDVEWILESLPRLFDSSLDGIGRVREIVKNLRDFARLDEAELDNLDLNAALRSTVDVLSLELETKQIAVDFQLDSTLPRVGCQPAKIHQVFHNLLRNAIQASEPKGTITIRTCAEQDHAVIEIADQGCGISDLHLPRVFEPFFTTQPVGQGKGLGLAICHGIIRDHDGTIEVYSQSKCGATFRVRLPLRPAKE
ncbi:response regulator [Roseiconus nitratireducens]|uniref:histidine kinase n=1 Tax=Roseiconus nitratireducens TaxID=2605748 RepID=A0A5M6DA29_9BACT|nr:response regulator [Roseiconus nitratireducens]KAA5543142.1 response regulator [Roseiconus nitratireducens]